MTNITLSIIVPAYNVEPYLERCVRSIQAQTYSDLEILLVDDGSTDRTGTIAEDLACRDGRIKVIHQSNRGVTCARLAGVNAASGHWIGFVDGDDEIEPELYARLLHNALAFGADISHCGYQMVFPDGHVDHYHNSGELHLFSRIDGLEQLLSGTMVEPGVWNKLFRRELFAHFPSINPAIRFNEDLLMNFYLFRRASSSVFEDICPYRYLLRPDSTVTSGFHLSKLEDPLRVTDIIRQESEDLPQLHSALLTRLARQLILGAAFPIAASDPQSRRFRHSCRKRLRSLARTELRLKNLSPKLKIMTLWAAISPDTYALAHRLYQKASGTDRTYKIN